MTSLPHGSLLEHECNRVRLGRLPRKYARGAQIERDRTAGALSEFNGLLDRGFDVSSRIWTLHELEVAAACRYRWFMSFAVGLRRDDDPWQVLQSDALNAATSAQYDGRDPLRQAERALRVTADRLRTRRRWTPGALWESRIIEILHRIETVLTRPEFCPPGWNAFGIGEKRPFQVTAAGQTFCLELEIDRLDQAASGLVLTSYAPSGSSTESPFTREAQLALLMTATGAVAGRTLDLQRGSISGLQHHVRCPQQESPIVVARQVLADIGQALADGRVDPRPQPGLCRSCPVRMTCRAMRGT